MGFIVIVIVIAPKGHVAIRDADGESGVQFGSDSSFSDSFLISAFFPFFSSNSESTLVYRTNSFSYTVIQITKAVVEESGLRWTSVIFPEALSKETALVREHSVPSLNSSAD